MSPKFKLAQNMETSQLALEIRAEAEQRAKNTTNERELETDEKIRDTVKRSADRAGLDTPVDGEQRIEKMQRTGECAAMVIASL